MRHLHRASITRIVRHLTSRTETAMSIIRPRNSGGNLSKGSRPGEAWTERWIGRTEEDLVEVGVETESKRGTGRFRAGAEAGAKGGMTGGVQPE